MHNYLLVGKHNKVLVMSVEETIIATSSEQISQLNRHIYLFQYTALAVIDIQACSSACDCHVLFVFHGQITDNSELCRLKSFTIVF